MKIERITRDLADGVMAIASDGEIVLMNPAAQELLGIDKGLTGRKYAEIFAHDPLNDEFHQMLIDALMDAESIKKRQIRFHKEEGTDIYLEVTSSVMWDDSHEKKEGVVLSFSDQTYEIELKKKIKDSCAIYLMLIMCIACWVYDVMIWYHFGKPISASTLSKVLMLMLLPLYPFVKNHTGMSLRDMGFRIKGKGKYIIQDLVIAAILALAMIGMKIFIMRRNPSFFGDKPFFDLERHGIFANLAYAFSVVLQEFITRGVVYETLSYVVDSKHHDGVAVIVSSMIFGSMHLHLSIVYMFGAAALLGVLGLLYNRQKSIWGLCIPHYVLGLLLDMLGFV